MCVAQLDRASGYGPEGREFESCRARGRDPVSGLSGYRVSFFSSKNACFVIIQHLLELLMIQSDKLAYLADLSGPRGRTSGETALSAHSEEHEVF